MRRFRITYTNYQNETCNEILALVRTSKGKYKFVNLTTDSILKSKFKTPNKALDWLDLWLGEDNWTGVEGTVF